jgi:cobalt-zinc-cadmium efflux system outer membrane protein
VAGLRLKAGAAADVDVARLQVELARAEADLADATTAKRSAQITLAQLVGLPSDRTQFEASDDWPAVTAGYSAQGAVNQRPDVRAANERLDKAQASVALARSQLTHDVTVGAQYERFPQPDVGPNMWGIGFSIPLFLRNRFEGEIARAGTDRRLAEQQLQQTQLAAQADRDLATAQLEGAVQRVRKFQEEVVTQARKAADAEEYAYSRGSLALTDLLDARRSLQAVLLDALNARATYAKALAAWKAATSAGSAPGGAATN